MTTAEAFSPIRDPYVRATAIGRCAVPTPSGSCDRRALEPLRVTANEVTSMPARGSRVTTSFVNDPIPVRVPISEVTSTATRIPVQERSVRCRITLRISLGSAETVMPVDFSKLRR